MFFWDLARDVSLRRRRDWLKADIPNYLATSYLYTLATRVLR